MNKFFLSAVSAIALASAFAMAPAQAAPKEGFTLNLEYESGSLGLGGGLNGNIGGAIVKRTNESGSGSVNEVDINVQIDKNGMKKLDGTVHSGAYGYSENMIKTKGAGAMATGSAAGSYVVGGSNVDLTVKKK